MLINISRGLEIFEEYISKNLELAHPENLYGPRNYIMQMKGKRLRALFCLIGYNLYSDEFESALPLAFAVELFHNFTLLHDDWMDAASLRRGWPTVHEKYGDETAILTGDVMHAEVFERLSKLDKTHALDIIRLFSATAREVCEGQSMDMAFEKKEVIPIRDYLKMIELKTAVLLGQSIRLGGLYAGAAMQDQKHLYHFGLYTGLSFQLQDDLLDVYSDPSKFGKTPYGDILQGKKTYLYIRTLDLLGHSDRLELIRIYNEESKAGKQDERVNLVKQYYDQCHVDVYCDEAKNAYYDLARSHLKEIDMEETDRAKLLDFTGDLLLRQA